MSTSSIPFSDPILNSVEKIRAYGNSHQNLKKAMGGFVFDFPLTAETTKCDFVIMGVNPGESEAKKNPLSPKEATSATCCPPESGSAKNWKRRCKKFLGTDEIFLTEFFFWPSKNHEHFKERYGRLTELEDELKFCKCMNEVMLNKRRPRAVIFSGLTYVDLVSRIYGLQDPRGSPNEIREGRYRLLVEKTDSIRPWFFVPHLSASRGITNEMRKSTYNHIMSNSPEIGQ